MSTRNLQLKLPRNIKDQFMGLLEVLKQMGPTAYKLDPSYSVVLNMMHPVFHINLFKDFEDNELG